MGLHVAGVDDAISPIMPTRSNQHAQRARPRDAQHVSGVVSRRCPEAFRFQGAWRVWVEEPSARDTLPGKFVSK